MWSDPRWRGPRPLAHAWHRPVTVSHDRWPSQRAPRPGRCHPPRRPPATCGRVGSSPPASQRAAWSSVGVRRTISTSKNKQTNKQNETVLKRPKPSTFSAGKYSLVFKIPGRQVSTSFKDTGSETRHSQSRPCRAGHDLHPPRSACGENEAQRR